MSFILLIFWYRFDTVFSYHGELCFPEHPVENERDEALNVNIVTHVVTQDVVMDEPEEGYGIYFFVNTG